MTELTGAIARIIASAETKRATPADKDFNVDLHASYQKTRPCGSLNGKPQASSPDFAYAYASPLNENAQNATKSIPAASASRLSFVTQSTAF